eukprot:4293115-Amphidinium_carterae.1
MVAWIWGLNFLKGRASVSIQAANVVTQRSNQQAEHINSSQTVCHVCPPDANNLESDSVPTVKE